MKTYHVHAEFVQPILGTASADPQIHERFIASKAPDAKSLEEEVEALGADELVERGTTVFPRTKDGTPFLWDYQLKGFFKDAAGACRQMDGMDASRRLVAHKSKIDQLVFVTPRNVRLYMPEGSEVRVMQRPLRAQTARGERVALAASEMLDAGTVRDFDVAARRPPSSWTASRSGCGTARCAASASGATGGSGSLGAPSQIRRLGKCY